MSSKAASLYVPSVEGRFLFVEHGNIERGEGCIPLEDVHAQLAAAEYVGSSYFDEATEWSDTSPCLVHKISR